MDIVDRQGEIDQQGRDGGGWFSHDFVARLTGVQFHGKERPVIRLANFKDSQTARVLDAGDGIEFTKESPPRGTAQVGFHELDCHLAIVLVIKGEEDSRHPTGAKLVANLITPREPLGRFFLDVLSSFTQAVGFASWYGHVGFLFMS